MRHDIEDEEDLGALYDQTGNERDREQTPKVGHNRGLEEDDALDDMDFTDILREGRKDLLKSLVKAVRGGYATPAQENTLRQMLKDNGMVMGDPDAGAKSETQPKVPLPTFGRPEYDR